ncbi:hypothetical protein QQF64_008221 [Cirrhinus molitorella]|uniref:Uncharacterized protein n=1 Tax=Cirrhinus molitorella TaxID=172907 RepID=A0ABR3M8K3_9TELE
MAIHPSIYPSIPPSIHPFISLSIHPSIHSSMPLSIHPSPTAGMAAKHQRTIGEALQHPHPNTSASCCCHYRTEPRQNTHIHTHTQTHTHGDGADLYSSEQDEMSCFWIHSILIPGFFVLFGFEDAERRQLSRSDRLCHRREISWVGVFCINSGICVNLAALDLRCLHYQRDCQNSGSLERLQSEVLHVIPEDLFCPQDEAHHPVSIGDDLILHLK